jgi:hypothetical protein
MITLGSFAFADEPAKAPEPPPQMQPEQVGPRTEAVDLKAYATVLHVAPAGSEQNDGSAEKPLATVAQAMKRLGEVSGDKRAAVLVAAGEYKGETLEMKPYVDLFGGFDASWKRDIDANRSVLDGEGQRRVVVGADNAKLDGFVVQNGKAPGPGGGILCEHVSPTISNNTFIHNTAQEPPAIHKEMYHQHGNDGGAIACITGSNAVVSNNIVAGNMTEVGDGAGIAVANWSMPHLLNNVVCENVSGLTDVKRSRSSNGAGISASNALNRPPLRMTLINNVICNNRAHGNSDAGGVYCEYDSSPIIGANWILGNWAEDDGSAVYIMKSSHPLFTHNIVAGHGNHGAMRLSKEGRADIEDNLLFDNSNALTSISSWMSFKNNTVVNNGAGVYHENTYAPHLKPPIITENLIYSNGKGNLRAPNTGEDAAIVTDNDIEGGYAQGKGNFDEKPEFVADGVTGAVKSIAYDDQRALTTIAADGLPDHAKLQGRIINIGDKWGVIKQAGDGKLLVWGNVAPKEGPAGEFKISPTYTLKSPLAHNVGMQPSR